MNASTPDSRPVAMLVLGMHRSGTSATAGSLRLLGVELGDSLIAAADDNPKGYWEHAAAVDVHEQLLAGLSRSWDDVRPLPDGWQQHKASEAARSAIGGIVAEFDGASFWALKDPRLSRFTTLWLAELARARHDPLGLFVVRDPDEVAASLQARNGFPASASHLLWIRHVLEAARDTAQVPRAMITYDALLDDPCACLERVASMLGLAWPKTPGAARKDLRRFLDRTERHQDKRGGAEPAVDASLGGVVRDLYAQCVRISEGSAGWDVLNPFQEALDAFDIENRSWIDALGGLQQADAVMRHRALQQLQGQMDILVAELEALNKAKMAAETFAHERLDALARTEQRIATLERSSLDRLAETQRLAEALAETEQLGRDRLEEIQRLSAQLDQSNAMALRRMDEIQTQAMAHVKAEQLAFERLAETQRLSAQLDEANALAMARMGEAETQAKARETAEQLAVERLAEIQRLSAQLDEANAMAMARLGEAEAEAKARETAEQLAVERLAETQRLSAQLDEANALAMARLGEAEAQAKAHETAEQLAVERLAEIGQLTQALAVAETLGLSRLEEIQRLSARLDEANALALARMAEVQALAKAHERAEQLAFGRLAEIQQLGDALAESEKLGLGRLEEIQRLSARLDEANALALRRLDDVHVQAKAFATAEQMATERLAEIQTLAHALAEADKLGLGRLEEVQRLSAELDGANATAEHLAIERAAELERLTQLLHESDSLCRSRLDQLQAAHGDNENLAAELLAMRELLDALKRSFAWRIATPARALESLVKRKKPNR